MVLKENNSFFFVGFCKIYGFSVDRGLFGNVKLVIGISTFFK